MTTEKAIQMIDEYLLEPNNIDKAWVEVLELESQQVEIERLDVELKAMRGAANSYKAEVERLTASK